MRLLVAIGGMAVSWGGHCLAQSATSHPSGNEIRIVELQGTLEVSSAGATTWGLAQTNQILHPFDRLRTGANSRIALRWSDQCIISFDALTEIEILPAAAPGAQCGLHLIRGIASFFHRDKPGGIRVITRGAVAGAEGTEFMVDVDDPDRTTLSVIGGKVQFGNEHATLVLTNGQQASADFGKAPVPTAGFIANNVLQWCFYYPADFGFAWERVAELEFSFGRTDRALEALEKSLALAPRNAQALALKGFLLAAQNQTREAIVWLDRAIAVDSALGNAWLGRGLCRVRGGDAAGGREDLLLATALEPRRAGLRSYS